MWLDEYYDCSKIARDLKEAAGGQGEILEVRSTEKYGSINVFENGITEGDMGVSPSLFRWEIYL
ncbi:hypothetical protein AB7Z36_13810 [Providencia rettgeri]|nr:hypothetical protein BML2531_18710 [Providencia rettgeri]